MPLLEIEHVGPLSRHEGAARRLAVQLGRVLGAAPGTTWVRLRAVDPADYAEDGPGEDAARSERRPVLAHLLRFELPGPEARPALARALAEAIGEELDRPAENVHVVLEPMAAGRVAFGGVLTSPPPRHRVQTAAQWESVVGYARAVRVGDLVWVTGTTALDARGEPVGLDDAHAQAAQCIANLAKALGAVGCSLENVVRTRMFVTDIARDWPAIGRAHAEAFGAIRPATTMVEVRRLIADWMLVEIEADATL